MLPNGELPRNRDHILIDVQGRPHSMMLAHHRIIRYLLPPLALPGAVRAARVV
jgi:hypothetical protein